MQCPNCRNEILQPVPKCPRCGAALGAQPSAAAPQATMSPPGTMPLTGMNRARLIIDSVPLLFFIAALAFVVFSLGGIVGQSQPLLPLSLFMGFVVLVVAYQTVQRMRDLLLGVALVEEDVLERTWRGSRRGAARYGKFTRLGRMSMTSQAFHQGQQGKRYRVAYSPASKIVWSLEEVG